MPRPCQQTVESGARIVLQTPEQQDQVCGGGTLTSLELAPSKLLDNSDRQADAGVFSRDVIDRALKVMDMTMAILWKNNRRP